MGRYRFKLSDRILRAWFYKLKDMSSKGRSNPISTTANNIHSRKQKQAHVSASTTAHPSKPRQPHPSNPRKSYYFTRDVTSRVEFSDFQVAFETPRKSSKQKSRRRTSVRSSSPKLVSSCVSSGCSGRTKQESNWTKSDFPSEYSSSPDPEATDTEIRTDRLLPTESLDELLSSSSSSGYRVNSSANDIFIHVDKNSLAVKCDNKLDYHDTLPELEVELPPIITKPASCAKFSDMASDVKKKETGDHKTYNRSRSVDYKEPKKQGPLRVKIVKQDITSTHEQRTGPVRRFSVSSPGVRLRSHSPKIASRKNQAQSRNSVSSIGGIHSNTRRNRSLSDSFAVVKSSFDPQRDFRDSMAEMILENNIRASKDLEDLLACYLSLNSDEYHDLIIKVFKQLWFDLIDTR